MHILIGLITAIASLIWALNRLQNSGLNLSAFNPFFWARRRKWAKLVGTKPLHRIESTIGVASVLLLAVAKMDGDITREQKAEIIGLFQNEFELNKAASTDAYTVSSFLLQDTANITAEIKNILSPTKTQFQQHQAQSLLTMLNRVARLEGNITDRQAEFIAEVDRQLHTES